MAKRKRRNAITLVSLLLALVVLIVVYIWYTNRPVKSTTEETKSTIDLATIDTAKLSTLHYVKDDADIVLELKDNEWVSKNEPGRPMNQEYVKAILDAIKDIKADQVVMEKPENLADYGLAEPVATLEATTTDGTTVTIKIGDKAGESGGYYGMVNTDGIVYLMPIELGTALQYNNTQMTAVEVSPVITAANITQINITNRNGEDYELKYTDGGGLDASGNNSYPWQILKPYGGGISADTSKVQEIQSNYTSFKYISCVDYKGDDLSKYGLDNPVATIDLGYFETSTVALDKPVTDPQTGKQTSEQTINTDKEYKVFIGNKDADGNYYIREDGSNAVYTIDASTIDKMLKIDSFSLMNPYICLPNINMVDKIVYDINGTKYTMDIKHTTQKNADGKDETVATYYFNGNKVEEEAFKTLYQAMISAQYDAEVKGDVPAAGATPYMTLSFHLFGDNESTITASFLPFNDSFYLVQKDGATRFVADKRKIDAIAAAISSFTGKSTK